MCTDAIARRFCVHIRGFRLRCILTKIRWMACNKVHVNPTDSLCPRASIIGQQLTENELSTKMDIEVRGSLSSTISRCFSSIPQINEPPNLPMRFKTCPQSELKNLFVVSFNLLVCLVNIYFKNTIYLHSKRTVDVNSKLLSFENKFKLSRVVLY